MPKTPANKRRQVECEQVRELEWLDEPATWPMSAEDWTGIHEPTILELQQAEAARLAELARDNAVRALLADEAPAPDRLRQVGAVLCLLPALLIIIFLVGKIIF